MKRALSHIMAYLAVLSAFAAAAWIFLSGIVSFALLEWTAATDTALGRVSLLFLVGYMGIALLKDDK